MSSSHRLVAFVLALICSLSPLAAQAPPTRIMPLGDSITDGTALGTPGFGGYRGQLGSLLTAAGYNVDFVGTLTNNGANIPDRDHEGHSGWTISDIDSNIAGWLNVLAQPDVVLLHIGTNDFGEVDTINAINRLDALILKIATLRPYAHIIVTNLLERAEPANTAIQTQFNPFVQARVNAHAAAGRRVTFLNMRSVCPLSDMPDQLHPNQTGYNKMANAWLTAIQAVTTPLGDNLPPGIAFVEVPDGTHVAVTFSKPLQDAAAAPANFSINGLTVLSATLDAATKRVITLTTSPMAAVTPYTLSITGVRDRTVAANLIAPGTTAGFTSPPARGAVNNVAEAANYTLLYSLNLPTGADYNTTPPVYDIDNRNGVGPFTRVAYYLELQRPGQPLQYCWVSMNPFTSNPAQLGVPHVASGAFFQQPVASMNVVSNVPGVVNGIGLAGGNIEFWSTDYLKANSAAVPGASGTAFDFGDQPDPGEFGTMQIHNHGAAQTLIAYNNWGEGSPVSDLGIGNNPGTNPDWTYAGNSGQFNVRALQVFVKTADDFVGPALSAATGSFSRTKITVTFSEPVSDSSAVAQNFAVNAGVTVLSATLRPNLREIALDVTQSPPGTPLTLTVNGVRDRSPNANLIAPGANIAVTAPTLPAIIANNVPEAADYLLACRLDIPATQSGPGYNTTGTPYAIDDRGDLPGFDRVAYFLELATGGAPTYVWVSGDAFTTDTAKIAVPDLPSGASFQRVLENMNVVSNSPGITTGNGLTGWLEFWPTEYEPPNAAGVPGASGSVYDFGDQKTSGEYGSMQIHNPAAAQTLFAFNQWDYVGGPADLGIGNRPTSHPDWTFAGNAAGYTTRSLYVFVRPDESPPSGPLVAPVIVTHPISRSVNAGTATTFLVDAAGTSPFTYQWRRNGVPIPGATAQTYTIANAQAGSAGTYDAIITNAADTATSLGASLAVTGLTENPLSLRTQHNPGVGNALTYTASPHQPFIVERSIDLTLIEWENLASVSADATGEVNFTDPNPPEPVAFYRLRRVNP